MEDLLNDLLNDANKAQAAGDAGRAYIQSKAGASDKILEYIQANRLLTN